MDDLISRAAALEVIEAVKNITWSQSGKVLCGKMYSQIKDLSAVDTEPVVRCKDCKFRWDSIKCDMWSEGMVTPDDWYCAGGERIE